MLPGSARSTKPIDVLDAEEQEVRRIADSLLATAEQIEDMTGNRERATPAVAYGRYGVRSLDAVSGPSARGVTKVRSLAGGFAAWAAEIDPSLSPF